MRIENIKISELEPYEKNARTHPKAQIDLLAKNIEKFSFTTPILINKENVIIAGHGRLEAVKQLKREEVPCVRLENLSEKEEKALRLADNQVTAMSDWNMELVLPELKELGDLGDLTGFDKDLEFNQTFENKEIEEDDLGEFDCKCPKCGFIYQRDV